MQRLILLTLMATLGTATFLQAQLFDPPSPIETSTVMEVNVQEMRDFSSGKIAKKYTLPTRFPGNLPVAYTGNVIELFISDRPENMDHPVLRHFGLVYCHKLDNGRYSYSIRADFNYEAALKKYCEDVIQPKAPNARPVIYQSGKRKILEVKTWVDTESLSAD